MNDQPIIVGSSPTPAPLPGPASKGPNLSLILIIVLALGTIGFGIASVKAFAQAHTATSTLTAAKAKAAADARTDQKAIDDKANLIASESPYRSYTAPEAFGGFVVNFPKDWSETIDQEQNSTTQVNVVLNPNYIRRVNNVDDLMAVKIQLVAKPLASFLQAYVDKSIKQTNVTVSGIAGTQLTGKLPDKRAVRIVAIPVRDKTLLFINENSVYNSTFDTVLAQAKVNP